MYKALRFCAGSVAKKDFVPELTHFAIENGRVRGFNGTLALSSPIPFDIDCKPKATQLVKAVANCADVIQLSMTKGGRLSIKSGVFRAFIDCIEESSQHVEPEGERVEFDGKVLLTGIKAISNFIGSDASRPWSNGILINGQSLFATNNITLVQYWTGDNFPKKLNIPKSAVQEMLRINEAPIYAQVSDNSVSFHYEGERWLRTQLYSTEWPELGPIIDRQSNQQPIHEKLFEGLDTIKPFVDKLGTVYFADNHICTHTDEHEGARFDIEGFSAEGKYNIEMLYLLKGSAKTIDWSNYPGPCAFQGDRLRGVIIGMRK